MRFDARRAKLLAPGEAIIVDDAPGLRLVATATRKTWTYRYKSPVDGRMRQVALGQWPTVSYAAALGAWQAARDQRAQGADLAQQRRVQRAADKATAAPGGGVYTVRALLQDYLAGHVQRHRKPKGAAEVRRLFDKYTGAIAGLPAESIRRAQAFELLETLGARAPVVANALRGELGAAWDYALDAGRISEDVPNWWRQIMRGKLRSRGKIVAGRHEGVKLRSLADAEVGRLLRFLPNFTALIDDLVTLYLWTGARGAEIVAMEGSEVTSEADGWWWTVPRHKLKMARIDHITDLRVPLVGRALRVVQRRMDLHGGAHLFPARSGVLPHVQQKVVGVAVWAVRPTTVTDRLPKHRPAVLDMDAWTPHDLRRTVRTTLAALGCPDAVGEAVLGHAPAGIVGVYNRHAYDAERRHWLTRLAQHWETLAPQG